MTNSRNHSQHLLEFSAAWFISQAWTHGRKCYFFTLTFRENLQDLARAKERFEPLGDWLRRHGVRWVGAWQRQKRGAWHCHLIIDQFVSIVPFRTFAVSRGWGEFLNLVEIKPRGSDVQSHGAWLKAARSSVRYLSRYVSRDACENDPGANGMALTLYGGGTRRGNVKFAWAGGLNKVWRLGCSLWCQIHDRHGWELIKALRSDCSGQLREEIMRLGLEEVFGDDRYTTSFAKWGVLAGPVSESKPF